jgi:FkbM family methyltransferase
MQPALAEQLRQNTELNDYNNRIFIHSCAVGNIDRMASIRLRPGQQSAEAAVGPSTGEGELIRVRRLDDLLANLPSARLIKIDVEGLELEVLQGATEIISKFRPVLVCEVRPSNAVEICNWLESAGYDIYRCQSTPTAFCAADCENVDNILCTPRVQIKAAV